MAAHNITAISYQHILLFITLPHFHGCCSFFNFVIMKQMIWTEDRVDAVGNTHIILIFAQKIVSMEENPRMEVTLHKANSV